MRNFVVKLEKESQVENILIEALSEEEVKTILQLKYNEYIPLEIKTCLFGNPNVQETEKDPWN